MNETGKIIQELRTKAGFTQKTLADALHITDKAVSKWERGICLPDVTLLPKLSLLLDIDVEMLVLKSIEQEEWVGLIDIHGCDFSQKVYDKPLVYYLLSHYLLLGIRQIYVITEEKNQTYLEDNIKSFGFQFHYTIPQDHPLMIINHPWFLFGSDLTQQFQGAMLSQRTTKLVPQNQEPVFYFVMKPKEYFKDPYQIYQTASIRTLGRGMISLDMGDNDKVLEVASFVRTYQQNAGLLIAGLEEIAYRKGYISKQQLIKLAREVPYGAQLLEMTKPQVD